MTTKASMLATIGLVAATAACGHQTGPTETLKAGAATASASPDATPSPQPISPQHDWDNPGGPGAIATTLANATTVGQLPFAPPQPHAGQSPTLVQVTDPGVVPIVSRRLDELFKFPLGPDFPTDGRLIVEMQATDSTAQTLVDMATLNQSPELYSFVDVSGHKVLIVRNPEGSIGNAMYIDRGVLYSVTGPAVSPSTAQKYAGLVLF